VNKEASHYVKLFGGNKIGNLTFWLPLVYFKYNYRRNKYEITFSVLCTGMIIYSFNTVRAVTCLFLTNAWRTKGLNAVSCIAVCVGSRVQKKWQQSNVKKRLCVLALVPLCVWNRKMCTHLHVTGM